MAELTDFLRRNKDWINSIYGDVNEIIAENSYEEFKKKINDYSQKYNDYQRFLQLDKNLTPSPLQGERGDLNSPPDNTSLAGLLTGMEPKKIGEEPNTPDNTVLSRKDRNVYDEFKNKSTPFDYNEYNRGLSDLLYNDVMPLSLRGDKGAKLADILAGQIQGLKVTEPKKTKPELIKDEGDNVLLGIDPETGNVVWKKTYAEKKQKQEFGLPKDSFLDQDESGNWYWFGYRQASDGTLEKYNTSVQPTQDQYDAYFGLGQYAKKTGTKGPGGFKLPDFDLSQYQEDDSKLLKEFAKLKEESAVSNWDDWAYEKDQFSNKTNNLNSNAQRYFQLEKMLQSRFPGVDIHKLSNEVNQETFRRKGEKYDVNDYLATQKTYGVTKNKLADFKKQTAGSWGRWTLDDKDPENNAKLWLNELQKHGYLRPNMSQSEFNALSEWFKETTGRDLKNYIQ